MNQVNDINICQEFPCHQFIHLLFVSKAIDKSDLSVNRDIFKIKIKKQNFAYLAATLIAEYLEKNAITA